MPDEDKLSNTGICLFHCGTHQIQPDNSNRIFRFECMYKLDKAKNHLTQVAGHFLYYYNNSFCYDCIHPKGIR